VAKTWSVSSGTSTTERHISSQCKFLLPDHFFTNVLPHRSLTLYTVICVKFNTDKQLCGLGSGRYWRCSQDGCRILNESASGSVEIIIPADPLREFVHVVQCRQSMVHGSYDKTYAPQKIVGRKSGYMAPERLGKSRSYRVKLRGQQFINEGERFDHAAADNSHSMLTAASGILGEIEDRFYENEKNLFQCNRFATCQMLGFFQAF